MANVACPYCGFSNFEISAYCGRCERPLRPVPAAPAKPPPPPPQALHSGPTAADIARRLDARTTRPVAPVVNSPNPQAQIPPAPAPVRPPPPPAPVVIARPATPPPPVVVPRSAPLPEALAPQAQSPASSRSKGPNVSDITASHNLEALVEIPALWRILAGRLVDAGCAALVFITACLSLGWALGRGFGGIGHSWGLAWAGRNADVVVLSGLAVAGALVLQELWVSTGSGQTLGRRLMGTVLVRQSGEPMRWFVALARAAMAVLSALFFGAGYFWSLVDRYNRSWHDLLCGTVIVQREVRPS